MTVHSILLLSILSAFLQIRWWNGPTNAIELLAMLKEDKYYGCYQTSWPCVVGPCHHGMARPQVADRGTASNMEGSCE